MEGRTKQCAKEKEGDRISKVCNIQKKIFKQPTSDECTILQTHASIQPIMCTAAVHQDSMSTLQAVLSKSSCFTRPNDIRLGD